MTFHGRLFFSYALYVFRQQNFMIANYLHRFQTLCSSVCYIYFLLNLLQVMSVFWMNITNFYLKFMCDLEKFSSSPLSSFKIKHILIFALVTELRICLSIILHFSFMFSIDNLKNTFNENPKNYQNLNVKRNLLM